MKLFLINYNAYTHFFTPYEFIQDALEFKRLGTAEKSNFLKFLRGTINCLEEPSKIILIGAKTPYLLKIKEELLELQAKHFPEKINNIKIEVLEK